MRLRARSERVSERDAPSERDARGARAPVAGLAVEAGHLVADEASSLEMLSAPDKLLPSASSISLKRSMFVVSARVSVKCEVSVKGV